MHLTQTPVHHACELASKANKCQEILKLLLQHGGDLYERDNAGVTPLSLLQLNNVSLYTTIVQDFCSKDHFNLFIILWRLLHVGPNTEDIRSFKSKCIFMTTCTNLYC